MTTEEFLKLINDDPSDVKDSEDGSYKFIPISVIEAKLDILFEGAWSWDLDREGFGKNYAFGKGTLFYLHPEKNQWIRRSGTAAVPLTKELSLDYPRLESACILNACKKIGRAFGRDLNRDKDDAPVPTVGLDKDPDHDAELESVKLALEAIPTREEAEKYLGSSGFRFRPELKAIVNSKPQS